MNSNDIKKIYVNKMHKNMLFGVLATDVIMSCSFQLNAKEMSIPSKCLG